MIIWQVKMPMILQHLVLFAINQLYFIIIQVNLDEWLYSFAKLAAVDQETFDKFIAEYDTVAETRGKFADFVR